MMVRPSTKKKSVQFLDDDKITTTIPEDILDPYWNPFTTCEEDEFCVGLMKKMKKKNKKDNKNGGGKKTSNILNRIKLQCSARIIQRFIRTNIRHWLRYNDEKCRFIEEMDNVLVIKKGEMERVSDFIIEMKREAKIEVALELGIDDCDVDCGEEEHENLKNQIEDFKNQIHEMGLEKIRLRKESDKIQKRNKQIALDTFGLYEKFTSSIILNDIKGMKAEQKRLQKILDQYSKVVLSLEGMIQKTTLDIHTERQERQQYEHCIDEIIIYMSSTTTKTKEKKNKKKLIGSLLEMKSSLSNQLEEYGVIPTIEV